MSYRRTFRTLFLASSICGLSFAIQAQSTPKQEDKKKEEDPLKRELTPEQKKRLAKELRKELGESFKKWLDSDVRWIISDEELAAFKQLSNDEERDQFIEQFWLRRDPTPDTVENEYKEEHYRRIAYANERFAAGIPGWKTDRGQIYIKFGPPDSTDSHPSGGSYNRPIEEGGGQTSTYPFEVWRYRYLEGQDLGQEVEIEFVDKCMCGAYQMTMDRSEKDALLMVPGAGLTLYEEMGMASKTDRFSGGGLERLGSRPGADRNSKMFDRLAQFHALSRPPAIKFKDLEEKVNTKIRYNLMPFDVRVDLVKVTEDTLLVPITVQVKNRDVTFNIKDGVARGVVNIFGRLTTMTGRIAQTFEDTVSVDVPESLIEKTKDQASVYWKALPLKTGRYKLSIAVKDVNSSEGRVGVWEKSVLVPNMGEDRGLASSTLILADQMEKVPTRQVGAGNFVIGDTKVRPRVEASDGKPVSFKRSQRVNFWMQVYNLGVDESTKKSSAEIEYQIVNTATNKPVVQSKENSADISSNAGDQLTLAKSLALASLEPGLYQVVIRVNDNVAKQAMQPVTAKFTVEN